MSRPAAVATPTPRQSSAGPMKSRPCPPGVELRPLRWQMSMLKNKQVNTVVNTAVAHLEEQSEYVSDTVLIRSYGTVSLMSDAEFKQAYGTEGRWARKSRGEVLADIRKQIDRVSIRVGKFEHKECVLKRAFHTDMRDMTGVSFKVKPTDLKDCVRIIDNIISSDQLPPMLVHFQLRDPVISSAEESVL